LKQFLLIGYCCVLLTGCTSDILPDPVMDTTSPFSAKALVQIGDRRHRAELVFDEEGNLMAAIDPDTLEQPMRQTAREGGTDVVLGDQHFTYPADWISAVNVTQLIRGSLIAPGTVTREEDKLRAEGIIRDVPYVIESTVDGKILLSFAFPTLDMKIELSDFARLP